MFGTPMVTFPAWLAKKHPEILSADIDGLVRSFGGRRQNCFNSETYWTYSSLITRKLVEHFASEEAIVAWQIDNEFGHEIVTMVLSQSVSFGIHIFLTASTMVPSAS